MTSTPQFGVSFFMITGSDVDVIEQPTKVV